MRILILHAKPEKEVKLVRDLRFDPVLVEPATVDACRTDYENGAAERHSSELRDADARRRFR